MGQEVVPPGLRRALEGLPRPLYQHIQRVRQVARELAGPLGLDPTLADLAAAAHDLERATPPEKLLARARAWGMPVHPVEERLPVLLHGPVAAERLPRELGGDHPQVLEAVRWHSTAARGLGPLALLIFLADKLDPHKVQRYPFLERVRELAAHDLERAAWEFLRAELQRLLQAGELVHPASLEAYNALSLALQGRGAPPP